MGSTTGGIHWEELTEEECQEAGGYAVGAWPIFPFDGEPGYCVDVGTFIEYIGCSMEGCTDNTIITICAEDAPDTPVYEVGQVCVPVGYVQCYVEQLPDCPT